jgi:exopolysaccharide production protein ExoY
MSYDGVFRSHTRIDEYALNPYNRSRSKSVIYTFDANASRVIDIFASAIVLLTVFPILLILCAFIFAHDGGMPIFMHRRIGRGGQTFPCLKLRTMVRDSEEKLRRHLDADPAARAEWARDQKLRSDPRITPLGRFLRKSSLDELPQLANVLIGHMSLVGPRPIVAAEVSRYGRYFQYYCSVRPGITGLWQVSGRNDTSYRRRVAMDTLYSRRRSLATDISILVRTVPAVLASKGSF